MAIDSTKDNGEKFEANVTTAFHTELHEALPHSEAARCAGMLKENEKLVKVPILSMI